MEQVTAFGVYLAYVDECLRRRGEDSASIFVAAGAGDVNAIQFGQRIPEAMLARVFSRLYRHPRLTGFFPELGAMIPVSSHGNLGLAFMVCPDVRDVLRTFERFAPIALPGVGVELEEQGEETVLTLYIASDFPNFSDALAEALVVNIVVSLNALSGQAAAPISVQLMQACPPYEDVFQRWLDCRVTFSAPSHRIVWRSRDLDRPVLTANPLNHRLLIEKCEAELAEVHAHATLADRVREILMQRLAENPDICEVARSLSWSERTLRRHLAEEGVSFRDLLKDVRQSQAEQYLTDKEMRIDEISRRLGYRNSSCFSQAFTARAGVSPSQWRHEAAHGPENRKSGPGSR